VPVSQMYRILVISGRRRSASHTGRSTRVSAKEKRENIPSQGSAVSGNKEGFPGLVCKELVNECSSPRLNDCDQNAICVDTVEAYTCICRPGYTDMDEFRNPGRRCHK
ncbi:EGF-like domain protein, partial [Teladorsagia circumcincta]